MHPDFRESLSTIVAMQLLQGESRYMMVPLLVLSLMGTDFSKQRPCESIDTRNPCEMRRDCCWQTKYTKIEKMLGPVWKRSEWCEECPADYVNPLDPPPPSPPPPSPTPAPPPVHHLHSAWDHHPHGGLANKTSDHGLSSAEHTALGLRCQAPGPDCLPVPQMHDTPPSDGDVPQPPIGGAATRAGPPGGDDVGGGAPVGWATPIRNQFHPSHADFWLAKQGNYETRRREKNGLHQIFPVDAMKEGAAVLAPKGLRPPLVTPAQKAEADAENAAALRGAKGVADTLGGGKAYATTDPHDVWAGQGEKMGKPTGLPSTEVMHLAAEAAAPAPRTARDTLLWLGDGRGAPPPALRRGG